MAAAKMALPRGEIEALARKANELFDQSLSPQSLDMRIELMNHVAGIITALKMASDLGYTERNPERDPKYREDEIRDTLASIARGKSPEPKSETSGSRSGWFSGYYFNDACFRIHFLNRRLERMGFPTQKVRGQKKIDYLTFENFIVTKPYYSYRKGGGIVPSAVLAATWDLLSRTEACIQAA